eukprot:s1564_g9.t1
MHLSPAQASVGKDTGRAAGPCAEVSPQFLQQFSSLILISSLARTLRIGFCGGGFGMPYWQMQLRCGNLHQIRSRWQVCRFFEQACQQGKLLY